MPIDSQLDAVAEVVAHARRVLVFTGAGISTESGLPDFRGESGIWKRVDPSMFVIDRYLGDRDVRRQFWQSRTFLSLLDVEPNPGHDAIVELERLGLAPVVVTQNMDELHRKAGSSDVLEMHGNIREVVCVDCGARSPISEILGRVDAGEDDPTCEECGGILKVAAVLFGEQLDDYVLGRAYDEARRADVCLAVGSTLSVWPAALIPAETMARGGRLVIVNMGETAYDRQAYHRLEGASGKLLPAIVQRVKAILA